MSESKVSMWEQEGGGVAIWRVQLTDHDIELLTDGFHPCFVRPLDLMFWSESWVLDAEEDR